MAQFLCPFAWAFPGIVAVVAAAAQAIEAVWEAAAVSAVAVDVAGASRTGLAVVGAVPSGTVGEMEQAANNLGFVVSAVV